jgi:ribosomal protein L7Ae-like RNA K-turn-binding protein
MTHVFLFESENLTKERRLRFVLDDQNKLCFDCFEKAKATIYFYIPSQKEFLLQFLEMNSYEKYSWQVQSAFDEQVLNAVEKSFFQAVSIAKKSGLLVVGLAKIQEYLRKNSIKATILVDGAGKDVSKRVHSWKSMICHGIDGLQLEKALGMPNISVVAVRDRRDAGNLLNTYTKLQALK